jgi:hypothetical protein
MHHTFLAPQYRHDRDPIAIHPTLNLTWHPIWNLDGLWTSATRDGALRLDSYRIRMTAVRPAPLKIELRCR